MHVGRRKFVKQTAGMGIFLATGCRSVASHPEAKNEILEPPAPLQTRKSIWSLDPYGPELNDYRKAIEVMMAMPKTDHRSWEAQALVHYDSCPHGNWFFLSWHRSYILHFEKLIQKYSGNPNFTLPYWDWTAQGHLPPAFSDASPGNKLFHEGRAAFGNIPDAAVGTATIKKILAIQDFLAFAGARAEGQRDGVGAGRLEGTPHNRVHNWVGGDMATYLSPRDPIFWLHHANVDRLWAEWARANPEVQLPPNPAPGGDDDAKLNTEFWLNFPLTGYFDTEGLAVQAQARNMLSPEVLGYTYDTLQDGKTLQSGFGIPSRRQELALAGTRGVASKEATSNGFYTINMALTEQNKAVLSSVIKMKKGVQLRLEVRNIPIPKDLSQSVRIFLNSSKLSPLVGEDDPHFVGAYNFFGPAHAEHGGSTRSALFDLDDAIRRNLGATRSQDMKLSFQIQLQGSKLSGASLATFFAALDLRMKALYVA